MAALIPDIPKVEMAIVEMTNAVRQQQGLSRLTTNPQLTNAARAYAKFLASRDLFSHSADGRQPAQRATDAGYTFCEIAENLAWHRDGNGFDSLDLAASALTGWLNSPGHRANLMNGRVSEIGVAVAELPGGSHKFFAVQMLGLPRSAHIRFSVTNTADAAVTYSFGGKSHTLKPRVTATHGECASGPIVFSAAGSLLGGGQEIARFAAVNGQTYIIRSEAGGRLSVAPSGAAAPDDER